MLFAMPDDPHYLSGLDLTGRRVVMVGGGTVAQRRLPRLVGAGARVEVVSPETTPSVSAMADAGEIVWHERAYQDGDLADAWYALACTNDPEVNAAVCAEAERARVFCVRADGGTQGTAVTPASGRHGWLLLGVLSGGTPLRSASVRDSILDGLRAGTIEDGRVAPEELPGVALVGGGPGDPELITVRGRRLLARADVVVVDRLAPRELLDELAPEVEIVDAAKIPYARAASQEVINSTIIEAAKAGKFVVRLKGGDPYLFGRGFEEYLACVDAGIPVTMVPGITSAFAVPAIANVPVTHRGVAHEVVVVSGHVAPDHPASLTDWAALAKLKGTIVLMMGVERLPQFAQSLLDGGRPSDTPVAIIEDGTMRTQRVLKSTLDIVAAEAKAAGVRPPAVIVIGPVAGLV